MALTTEEVDLANQATPLIICNGCGVEKPVADYWGSAKTHCQHKTCKECHRARKKIYRETNKEKLALKKSISYQANKEYYQKKHKQWRLDNPEKIKAYNKKKYHKNKAAMREKKLQEAYKISLIEYNELFILQNGRCGICNKHQRELKKRLHVDHNHTTGQIRGLLCNKCNLGLGTMGDSVESIKKALIYLGEPSWH